MAENFRNDFGYEEHWNALEDTYLSTEDSAAAAGPNLIWSESDSLLSGLIVPDPELLVNPLDRASAISAPAVEAVDNMLMQEDYLSLKKKVELANLNTFLYGRGFMKIGFDSEFGWSPQFGVQSPAAPNLRTTTFTQFDKNNHRLEFNNTKPGMPWVSNVLPHDMLVSYGTQDDIETASWVAHRFVRLNANLKADKKYKNTGSLQPDTNMRGWLDSYKYKASQSGVSVAPNDILAKVGMAQSDDIKYNICWEIHDKRTGKIYVISHNHDKFLRNETNFLMKALGGYPFVTDTYVKHPRNLFWSIPQAYYLKNHQEDVFDIYKTAAKQRRAGVLKFLMNNDIIDDDELAKMTSADVGAVAKTNKSIGNLRDAILPLNNSANNFVLHQESEMVRRNARDATGQSRNQAGEFDASSRRTATEVQSVAIGSSQRSQRRIDITKRFYSVSMKKANLLGFAYWLYPVDVFVGNSWASWTGDQLKGRYAYNTVLTNKVSMSKPQREAAAFNILLQMAQLMPGSIDPNRILGWLTPKLQSADFVSSVMTSMNQMKSNNQVNQINGQLQQGIN